MHVVKNMAINRLKTDQEYPCIETITFNNPLDVKDRRANMHWVHRALEIADIRDAVILEQTKDIVVKFRNNRDYLHFQIAHDMPVQHFTTLQASDFLPVSIDFISLLPRKKDREPALNSADSIFMAFQAAAEKSGTISKIDFDTEDNKIIIVNAPDPRDYFAFWKAVPTPLRNSLEPI